MNYKKNNSIIEVGLDESYDFKNINNKNYNFKNKKFKKILQTSMLNPPKLERSVNINLQELPKIIIMQNETYFLKLIDLKSIDTLHGKKKFLYKKQLKSFLKNIHKLKEKCEKINQIFNKFKKSGIKVKNKKKILDNSCINVIPKYLECFNDYNTKLKIYEDLCKILKLHNNFIPIYKVLLMKKNNNRTEWEDTYMLMTLFGEIYYLNYKSEYDPVKYSKYTEPFLIKFF